MKTSTVLKKLSMVGAGATFVALGVTFAHTTAANAAIVALNDSNSWVSPGTNTLTNLGFNMVTVPDPGLAVYTNVTTLSSPLGNLTFTPSVNYRKIGSGWLTWSNGYTGEVYSSDGATSIEIDLPASIAAFDLYVEPDPVAIFDITVTAQDGTTTSLTQAVNGNAGAKYFGFYGTGGDLIDKITVSSSQGFAVGQLRLGAKPVPEPASVLGLLTIGVLGAGSALKHKLK
jgi:hypothetical protein